MGELFASFNARLSRARRAFFDDGTMPSGMGIGASHRMRMPSACTAPGASSGVDAAAPEGATALDTLWAV